MQDLKSSGNALTKIRCAIYTRVSTDSQAEVEFNSCEAQEARIISFIDSQENYQLYKTYSDPGYTGANMDRPGLRAMLSDSDHGRFDVVLTYKIDRLTRSPKDFYQLIEYFEARNVSYVSVTERFDTSSPSGRLLRNIMLTFAQFERELVSERVRDKMLQLAKKGLPHCGPPPFGYKRVNGRYVIDEKKARIVREIYELYTKMRSLQPMRRVMIEKGLTHPSGSPFKHTFVWDLLRNVVLTGKVSYRGKVYPGQHEPIISEDLFNYVQSLHNKQLGPTTRHNDTMPFTGFIRCSECNSIMTCVFTNKYNKGGLHRYFYYRCTKISHDGWKACSIKEVSAEKVHDLLISNLKRISADFDYLKNLVFVAKYHESKPDLSGIELEQSFKNLTPENLQKTLQTFLKDFARRTGVEKAMAVGRTIRQIIYSKEKIALEVYYEGLPHPQPARLDDKSHDSSPIPRAPSHQRKNIPFSFPRGIAKRKGPHPLWEFGPTTATYEFDSRFKAPSTGFEPVVSTLRG